VKQKNQYLDLLDMPITKILKEYNKIEKRIIDDLIETIGNILMKNGYSKKNDLFILADEHYKLIFDFLKNTRTLIISLNNIIEKTNRATIQCDINSFGMIRSVILELPNPSPLNPDKVNDTIKSQILMAYTALEQAIISNFESLERKVFEKLYDCLAYQFKISNKKHLLGRFWLFIAEIDVGFYFFDKKNIELVIEHYKSNQDANLSPLELTIWLLTAPLPYKESLAFQAKHAGRPLSLNWKKAKYIGEAENIFRAEVALYDSEEYTGYTLCESRGLYLVIGCPTEIAGEIFPEIRRIEENLTQYFTEGLKEWSPFLKLVKTISHAADESKVAEFVGTVIGNAGPLVIKGLFAP